LVRHQLRLLSEFRNPYIGGVFALVVFFSDEFLTLKTGDKETKSEKAQRFFKIVRQLPMELQMVLCNRMFGSSKELVLTEISEPAFKKLARLH
jgi:hypothetical protein